jgi:hypothetical protein
MQHFSRTARKAATTISGSGEQGAQRFKKTRFFVLATPLSAAEMISAAAQTIPIHDVLGHHFRAGSPGWGRRKSQRTRIESI